MLRSIVKLAAYRTAPRATFAVAHPAKALRMKKLQWDMRHSVAPRVAAAGAALGALALALPAGMLLGRRRSRARSNGDS
jgi:hypothetical protein